LEAGCVLSVTFKVSFTIVVTPTAAGALTDQASVAGNQSDPTPADNTMTVTTTVDPRVQRHGFHSQPTTLVLNFGIQLDPARSENPANYQLVALGGSERTIRIKSALYDPATRTVTLSPVHRLNLHNLFRLTVVETGSSGMTDISGNLLGDPQTGDRGSNFVTMVSAVDLVLTTTDPSILREYQKIVSSPAPHLGAAGPRATSGESTSRRFHLPAGLGHIARSITKLPLANDCLHGLPAKPFLAGARQAWVRKPAAGHGHHRWDH